VATTPTGPRSRIFICYRHGGEGEDVAGRLYDNLVYRFGKENVFRDIVALEPGSDYASKIDEALDTACATVVVITPDWATIADEKGQRRLDNPRDFVRLEVGTALQQGELVVPVLVKGATMPRAETLPPDLSSLSAKHALTMTDLHWEDGMERLIAAIEPHFPKPDEAGPTGIVAATTADGDREPKRVVEPGEETSGLRRILGPAALTVVGGALLLAGVFITLPEGHGHTLISNDFGGAAPDGGRFTALSPLSLVIGSLVALILACRESTRGLAAGLLLGFGIAGCATYVGVWTFASGTSGRWLPSILGGVLLVAAAVWLARTAQDPSTAKRDALVTVLALAGAVLILVGALVPYSDYKGSSSIVDKGWGTYLLPFVCAAATAVLAAAVYWVGLRALWLGALIAIGVCSCLVFVRFIGVPVMRNDGLGAGAFLGAIGSLLAVAAGGLGYARARRAQLSEPIS
jgi:hypothetical protein